MELKVYNKDGIEQGTKVLPVQFEEAVREDLIARAVSTIQSNARQAYGADPSAGKRHSAKLSKRRRKYRGSYGFGISRVSRKILSRNGTRFNWTAAFVGNAVGGRTPHAPTAEKNYTKKLNTKERKKAIRSALAASVDANIVSNRGHAVPKGYPFVLSDDVEALAKTKDVVAFLTKMSLTDELARAKIKKVRAGKGKSRSRRYKQRVGPLVVVSKDSALLQSANNIPGLDVVVVDKVNASLLAPGTHAGRMTFFTTKALDEMQERRLFL
ncbi:MAG: 50S ribosomal protein L4 [Candidatus Woesearchaeota archaeon]